MRSYAPSPTVNAPDIPLSQMGWKIPQRRLAQTVRAPQTPINSLGWRDLAGLGASAPAAVAATAPIDATVASMAASHIAAISSAAGPIGAGVGILVGLIAGLWAAHEARIKGAKTENAVMNSAVQTFDASLQAIFSAANSGQVTAAQASSACQTTLQNYWSAMRPYQSGPGAADASNGGSGCARVTVCNQQTAPGLPCNKSCTAGCCVGCDVLTPTINQAIAIFQAGSGTLTVCPVYGSGYGGADRASYTLSYTPPAPTATSTVTNAISSALSPSTPGGSSSLLLLGALGLGLFLVMR